MRIGIEAQRLLRPHRHGMDIVALELIKGLQQIDHINDYFIFVRSAEDDQCLDLPGNFTLVKIPGANYIQWEQIALPIALRKYRLDVLHCTANTAPLLVGVPLILTLHDVLFLSQTSGVNTATAYQRFGNRYRALLIRQLVRRCGHILTVSKYAAQQIKSALDIAYVDVLYNGIGNQFGIPVCAAQLANVQKKYQLPARYFLFLGSADPRKNIKNVFLAFIKYSKTDPEIHLVVSGLLPLFLAQLLTPDECAFIEERCQFIGYIADDELPALYTLAEIFLFPSISEGFGLPILEAMACGTPVITSTLTAMPEIAGSAALLVDPNQPDRIAEAMQQISQDQALRHYLIRRGKERVLHFSWTRTSRQLLAIYKTYEPAGQEIIAQTLSIA